MFKIGDRVRVLPEYYLCGLEGTIRCVYTSGTDIVVDLDVDLVSRKIIYYEISIDALEMVKDEAVKENDLTSKLVELSELDVEIEALNNTRESCIEDRQELLEEIKGLMPKGYKIVEDISGDSGSTLSDLVDKHVVCIRDYRSCFADGEKLLIVSGYQLEDGSLQLNVKKYNDTASGNVLYSLYSSRTSDVTFHRGNGMYGLYRIAD